MYLNLKSDGRRMHVNSNNVIDGWDTDAYLLAVTRPDDAPQTAIEKVTRYFVAGCSYLRRDDQIMIDSFSKVTTAFQSDSNCEVLLQGQPRIEAAIIALQKPTALKINGQSTAFSYDSSQKTLRFRYNSLL